MSIGRGGGHRAHSAARRHRGKINLRNPPPAKDGWCSGRDTPAISEQDGRRFLALARGITERKRAEQRVLRGAITGILAQAPTVEEAHQNPTGIMRYLEWDISALWLITGRRAYALRGVVASSSVKARSLRPPPGRAVSGLARGCQAGSGKAKRRPAFRMSLVIQPSSAQAPPRAKGCTPSSPFRSCSGPRYSASSIWSAAECINLIKSYSI